MSPSPASCCSVFVESIVETPSGPTAFGFATGFLYAGPAATRWLVTNWHVVTGRRPDEPGALIGGKPQSPSWLRFTVEDPRGSGRQQMEVALYDIEGPVWIEGDREGGLDLALVRLFEAPRFPLPLTQTFARNSSAPLQPGTDVVLIGHPFMLGVHANSPIWKGAMIASEPGSLASGRPWILLDAPGVPGMSGSPVYRRSTGSMPSLGEPLMPVGQEVELELLAIYAGAIGERSLQELRLGRAFPVSFVERLLSSGERGHNPFPPNA
jgi:hypothetical protein